MLMQLRVCASEQALYVCSKCGRKNIMSVAKQVKSCNESTSVFSRCNDCDNKWRDEQMIMIDFQSVVHSENFSIAKTTKIKDVSCSIYF